LHAGDLAPVVFDGEIEIGLTGITVASAVIAPNALPRSPP